MKIEAYLHENGSIFRTEAELKAYIESINKRIAANQEIAKKKAESLKKYNSKLSDVAKKLKVNFEKLTVAGKEKSKYLALQENYIKLKSADTINMISKYENDIKKMQGAIIICKASLKNQTSDYKKDFRKQNPFDLNKGSRLKSARATLLAEHRSLVTQKRWL